MAQGNVVVIEYALMCSNGHRFDAWFGSARAYDEQRARGDVACPVCASGDVDKAVMAPALTRSRSDTVPLSSGHPDADRLRAAIKALRDKVTSEADYVGDRFAEEARKIHFKETDPRGIYGEATRDEVAGLVEDGIEFLPLPTLPDDQN